MHGHTGIAFGKDYFFPGSGIGGHRIVTDFQFFYGGILNVYIDKFFEFFTFNESAIPDLPIIIDNIVPFHLHGDPL